MKKKEKRKNFPKKLKKFFMFKNCFLFAEFLSYLEKGKQFLKLKKW